MRCLSMPKSLLRWTTSWSSSWNEPWSKRSWMRSRAVSFPSACCRAMRASPPPSSLSRLRRSSSSRFLCLTVDIGGLRILKQHLTRLGGGGDAIDTEPRDEDAAAVLDGRLSAVDEGEDFRRGAHDAEGDRADVHPAPHRPHAVARAIEVRRLAGDAAALDGTAVAVEAAGELLFFARRIDGDVRRHDDVFELFLALRSEEHTSELQSRLHLV